jgi:putative ABC transport system substrate-binding protein
VLFDFNENSRDVQALRQGLREAGYTEGRDVVLRWWSAKGDYARLPSVVADAVQTKPDIIITENTVAVRAAKQATSSIPIVVAVGADLVGSGLAESLAHPGSNITGMSVMTTDLGRKRLELLKEAIPGLKRVGLLLDPSLPWHSRTAEDLVARADAMGLRLTVVSVTRSTEIPDAFAALARAQVQALCVLESGLRETQSTEIQYRAWNKKIPVMYGRRRWVQGGMGALLSYSPDFAEMFRRSAFYADKILKGAKAGDLAMEQPTKFQLVINLNTAKALPLTVPESLVAKADEVFR